MSDNSTQKVSVLFVCMGNICRSPAGEGVFQKLIDDATVSKNFEVDSAGTIDYHVGHKADARMRAAASKRGYDLTSRARHVQASDLETFDHVIAMDRENLSYLKRLSNQINDSEVGRKIELLSDYLDDSWPSDVPDPYYGGDDGFEYVLDMIEQACPKMIESWSLNPNA